MSFLQILGALRRRSIQCGFCWEEACDRVGDGIEKVVILLRDKTFALLWALYFVASLLTVVVLVTCFFWISTAKDSKHRFIGCALLLVTYILLIARCTIVCHCCPPNASTQAGASSRRCRRVSDWFGTEGPDKEQTRALVLLSVLLLMCFATGAFVHSEKLLAAQNDATVFDLLITLVLIEMFLIACLVPLLKFGDEVDIPPPPGASFSSMPRLPTVREQIILDTFVVSEVKGEMCAICLGELLEGENATRLRCKHEFHTECLDPWLAKGCLCPMRCQGPPGRRLGPGLVDLELGLALQAGTLETRTSSGSGAAMYGIGAAAFPPAGAGVAISSAGSTAGSNSAAAAGTIGSTIGSPIPSTIGRASAVAGAGNASNHSASWGAGSEAPSTTAATFDTASNPPAPLSASAAGPVTGASIGSNASEASATSAGLASIRSAGAGASLYSRASAASSEPLAGAGDAGPDAMAALRADEALAAHPSGRRGQGDSGYDVFNLSI